MPTHFDASVVSSGSRRIATARTAAFWLSMALTIGFVSGCGGEPGLARVKGRITYKGAPVATGEVFFTPEEPGKRGAKGILDSNGEYSLTTYETGDGAYTGKHKVSVIAQGPDKPIPPKMKGRMMEEDMQGSGDPLIPRKYFSAQTSNLSAEVSEGKTNVVDFDLQD